MRSQTKEGHEEKTADNTFVAEFRSRDASVLTPYRIARGGSISRKKWVPCIVKMPTFIVSKKAATVSAVVLNGW